MQASLILGAGPGGTGPLVWAAQNGLLNDWLASGVTIFDRRETIGGTLGRYIINSDSLGTAYLECLDAPAARELFAPMRHEAATHDMEPYRYGLPPLSLVDRYLHRLGALLREIVSRHPASEFRPGVKVRALHLRNGETIAAEVVESDGSTSFVEARTAIMALGGRQDMSLYLAAQLLPGVRLADAELDKVMPSDALLTAEGLARAAAILDRAPHRRVAILGGSHSAFSVAWVLTNLLFEPRFERGDISILLRRQPAIFYDNLAAAAADGYRATENDVCLRTHRVNRYGGLRGDGRHVWRAITRRPGAEPEERVKMVGLEEMSSLALRRILDDAALIVPAFGYRSMTIPVFDSDGQRLSLNADYGGSFVESDARVRLVAGGALPNVFGIGLGTGFKPSPCMGGEPAFRGQANSLWLYQNDIGGVVYRGVQACIQRAQRRRARPTAAEAAVKSNGANLRYFAPRVANGS